MPLILKDLYFGNIHPDAKQFIRNTNFDKAVRAISDSESKLTEVLTGKGKELLLKMTAFCETSRSDRRFLCAQVQNGNAAVNTAVLSLCIYYNPNIWYNYSNKYRFA